MVEDKTCVVGHLNPIREYPDSPLNAQKPVEVRGSPGEDCQPFLYRGKLDTWAWDKTLRKKASKEYADWLLSDLWGWQWYNTLTFTEDIHPEQADKYYRRWVRRLNENFWGKRFRRYGKGITWIRGLEFQKRGTLHFHSLFAGLPEFLNEEVNKTMRFQSMKIWEAIGNRKKKEDKILPSLYNKPSVLKRGCEAYESKTGFARVYPYKEGACEYISKYVSKGGELDIFIGSDQVKERLEININ